MKFPKTCRFRCCSSSSFTCEHENVQVQMYKKNMHAVPIPWTYRYHVCLALASGRKHGVDHASCMPPHRACTGRSLQPLDRSAAPSLSLSGTFTYAGPPSKLRRAELSIVPGSRSCSPWPHVHGTRTAGPSNMPNHCFHENHHIISYRSLVRVRRPEG
jgi:hypothetical protein